MNGFWQIFTTTVGKKYVMAITGALLVLFVVLHMAGNLQVLFGAHSINRYADFIQSNPELLWPMRIGLLLCAVLHIVTASALTIENRRSRTPDYAIKKRVGATLASRTMYVTGSILLTFIVYHILHFTTGTTNPEYVNFTDAQGKHDVFRMIVTAFSNQWIVAAYLVGVGLLGFHLSHGVRAMCETIGWRRTGSYAERIDVLSPVIGWILFLGFATVPLAVLTGVVK